MTHRRVAALARGICTRTSRVFVAGTLIAGLFAVVGGVPAAHAATCDTSWTNASGGDWSTAANWSAGVPDNTKNACITKNGTYTVTASGTLAALSLTLGGATGTQTVSLQSLCGTYAALTLGANSSVQAKGVLNVTDTAVACGDYNVHLTQSAGTLTNLGTIAVLPGGGTTRNLDGAFANAGTLNIKTTTHETAGGTITNTGTVSIANGATLSADSATFLNNSGTVTAAGTGRLLVQTGAYTQGAGTTGGTSATPVVVDRGALHYTGAGASTVTNFGNTTSIDGNIHAGQTLDLSASCGNYGILNAATSWSNAGTIVLGDTTATCGDYYDQINTTGTLTNTGTIDVTRNGASTTGRQLQSDIVNKGTIKIEANTSASSHTVTNTGTISILTGASWTASNGALLNNAGTIKAAGTGQFALTDSAYTQGNGTTTGTATTPVVVQRGAIHYTGTGAGTVTQTGNSSSLDGNIAAGQTFNIAVGCPSSYGIVTAAASWSNAGAITMTQTGSGCGDYYAELNTSAGTLTNTGTIHVLAGDTSRHLYGAITNSGTIKLDKSTIANGTVTNTGTVAIADGAVFQNNGNAFLNNAGTVKATGTGTLGLIDSAYTQGNGTTTGTSTAPVIVVRGAIHYAGTGTSLITQNGNATTISGDIAANQTLNLVASCPNYAIVTAAASWTNAGTINEGQTGSGCGNYYTEINTTAGTFTNTGTIHVFGGDTERHLFGTVVNAGTLNLEPDANLVRGETLTFTSASTLVEHIAAATSFGHLAGSGPIALDGALSIVSSYTPAAKTNFAIITGSGETGRFATISGQSVPGGLAYGVHSKATGTTLVVAKAADLNVSGSAPATVPSGGQFSYTFTVGNAGPKPATKVKLTDTLPAGVTYGFGSTGCTAIGAKVTCDLGDIASGESVVVTITVDAGPAANTQNTATVSGSTVDVTPLDASAKVKVKIV